jgi:integrase
VTGNKLGPASIRRYLNALAAIFKLAIRRGIVHANPLALLDADERPTGGGVRDHYEWLAKEISDLIAASERVAQRRESRCNYSAMIRVLVLLGLRIGEAQAIRVQDVDLLEGVLHVRNSWGRNGKLGPTKTKAGVRDVPLSPGMVELFVAVIPGGAAPEHFVFHAKGNPYRPVSGTPQQLPASPSRGRSQAVPSQSSSLPTNNRADALPPAIKTSAQMPRRPAESTSPTWRTPEGCCSR